MKLKKRHITVTIGEPGLQTTWEARPGPNSMRIDFEVKKYANTSTFGMNTASIELYNLSDLMSKALIEKELPVLLLAGYEGEENIIFNGRVGTSLRVKKSADVPDVITNVLCSSGLKNVQQSIVNVTIEKMEIKAFLRILCGGIEVVSDLGAKVNANVTAQFRKNLTGNDIEGNIGQRTFNDNLMDVLTKLSNEFMFDFQVGENVIIFQQRQGKSTFLIKPENGLIGIPEITEMGVDLATFLNPSFETGEVFNLSSRFSNFKLGALNFLDRINVDGDIRSRRVNTDNRYEGDYRIIELIHKGSSHTNVWQSEITAQSYRYTKGSRNI